jgi:hypothetical protein
LTRCLWAWARAACVTCLPPPRRRRRASSSSTRLTQSVGGPRVSFFLSRLWEARGGVVWASSVACCIYIPFLVFLAYCSIFSHEIGQSCLFLLPFSAAPLCFSLGLCSWHSCGLPHAFFTAIIFAPLQSKCLSCSMRPGLRLGKRAHQQAYNLLLPPGPWRRRLLTWLQKPTL